MYEWIVPLPKGLLPEVDLVTSDFLTLPQVWDPCNREHRGSHRTLKSTEAIERSAKENPTNSDTPKKRPDCSEWSIPIETAIAESLPDGPGQRHRQVFDLARGLKAVPELADVSAQSLKPYVRRWHDLCKDKITTKPFEESWIDFLKGWPRVRQPKREDAMTEIFQRSEANPLPEVACEYEQAGLQQLVAFCREMQRSCGDGPYYLACRTAGRPFEVDHTTANRWLFLLVSDGVLEEVERRGAGSNGWRLGIGIWEKSEN